MSQPLGADETVEVDLPTVTTFTSGSVTGTVDQHLVLLKKTITKGINTGVNNFIRNFIQKIVAEDSGDLRAELILEFRLAVRMLKRTLDVSDTELSFEIEIPASPFYAKWHLDGTFGSAYKKPTTKGTRPTTMEELGEEASFYIELAVRAALTAKGFDYE